MKRLSIFFLLEICLCTCTHKYEGLNTGLLARVCNAEKGIIISCIRCSCVNEDLKDYLGNGNSAGGITFYGDTNCVKNILLTKTRHIGQSLLDSIYEGNYNLMLYRKQGSNIKFKLVTTEECNHLTKIAGEFFN